MAKQIELTQNKFAAVDDIDFEYLSQWKWHAFKHRHTFYAARNGGVFPFRKKIFMHRVIMDTPDEMETDHKDGNGLNNTRKNLRVCTHTQNMRNTQNRSENKSGFVGVHWHQGKWQALIDVDGKSIYLGRFSDPKEAAHAYDIAAKEYHGEFARTNF